MKLLEKKLQDLVVEQKPLDFPGGKVLAFSRGKKIVDWAYGKTWKYYDLASLTKIIFTTSVCMKLVEGKKLQLGAPIQKYLGWYPHKTMSVERLLNHSAGHVAWRPFYKKIDKNTFVHERWPQMYSQFRHLYNNS